ncbi:class I SAM-dependent methyltransferase [Actinosynnema pretiosum subsp. pretiosum]|uniref:Methyltransferase type 11 n=2 Tax=Actinosynnema TaxID=40566 RepID=C6WD93_ACTMD|nr:class I SAM-dependent methyltransferase [Actinosynnema mirum]ACU37712.1 Methyltransferase type 11 [Actinosynnema mirum DSM 43827]AXX31142.1 Methyltransferase type 11 [Actinosynnema pretiosum subsp. pretiosum]QUF04783.1 class I SAM-dependent methyltransferase [Actinosynnema pretiosum subsp. pretiosum]
MQQATHALTAGEVAAEWERRAARDGLARVMRASQPTALAESTTARTRELVAGHLDRLAPVGSALEIGCGMGRLTPTIAARASRVLALDMTGPMLDLARAACAGLSTVDFHRAPVQEMPVPRRKFDVAVCVWVLMHVLDEDELAEACRRIAASARHLVLVEYERAHVPVGRYSRLRGLADYLELLPGARLVERRELDYGGDLSFAALIELGERA